MKEYGGGIGKEVVLNDTNEVLCRYCFVEKKVAARM
jgi:hypothetical protein